MRRLLRLGAEHPWAVLALTAAVSTLALCQLVDLERGTLRLAIDPSPNRFLPEHDEAKQFYDHVRRAFGSDETLLVVMGAEDVFRSDRLRALARMTERIGRLDGVHHALSLTNAVTIRSSGDDLEIVPFLTEIPEDPRELRSLREEALSNPLYTGNLVSDDGRSAALAVYFMDFSDTEFMQRGLDESIRRIVEEERGDTKTWITGTPHLKAVQIRMLLRDLARNLPLILLVGMFVLAFSFRSVRGVLLPTATVILTLLWTMAVAVWLGRPLNLVTVLVPPLLMILGLSYAVHVVSEYYDTLRDLPGRTSVEIVGQATSHVALPVALTGLTTAAGFLALVLSPMEPIREFGLLSLIGITLTVIASLFVTPALLAALGKPRRRRGHATRPAGHDLFDRFAGRVAAFDLRARIPLFVGYGALTLLALAAATQMKIGTQLLDYFHPEAPARLDFDAVNARLDGANSFNVVVAASYAGAFKEPENLRALEALQLWLEQQPEIGAATSLADYLGLISRGFYGGVASTPSIPDDRRTIAQLLFFGASDEIEGFVDSRYQLANIVVRTHVVDSRPVVELASRIEEHLRELPAHLHGTVTGNPVLISRMMDAIARGQVQSLAGALLLIWIILAVLFLSPRTGAIALIPNLLPVIAYFGALGVSGILLSPATSLIAPMALGVAIDDTIHYFTRFNQEAKRHADERIGTVVALRSVGRPVTYTSVAICLGFLVLCGSELQSQIEVGALGAFTLGFAWLVDFTLTPALCSGLRVVTMWDTLTLDLGHEPQHSIPLFRGLNKAQARIVALMASLRSVPAGERLVHAGELGREMYVIIEGTLRVSVEGEHGRIELNRCSRGDVIGEVGLFDQKRSADVDVIEDACLLRLTQSNLGRLSRRYPRIATRIFHNLNEVLAERLLRTTERVR
ncbi:MAG: MMPL family transporter [Myxococcota bacterium]